MRNCEENERVATLLEVCQHQPDLFNELFLNRPAYWSRQKDLCRSVVEYRTTVAYSGNMVGKDFWVAGIVLWWLLTRPNSLCIITGPSQMVLGSVTFKEIRRCLDGALLRFGGKLSSGLKASPAVIEIAPGWQGLGFSTTSVERSSGQHAGHLLAVVEEASGVEDYVFDAIDSLGYERLVCIGNPIRAEGKFVDLIRQADRDRADNVPPRLAVNAIRIPSTESPHARQEKSEFGLADRTWLDSMYRKYGKGSLWVRSHIEARIPDVAAEQLIDPMWLNHHSTQHRPPTPPTHPIHRTRRIACDLSEGVGRDSTCIMVVDDWGVLEVVLSNDAGLPEAAATIHRLVSKWQVPHDRITFDKLGIGRNFPNHLARYGITMAIPYAGEGRPQDPNSYVNLRTEAGWKLHNRLNTTHPVFAPAAPGRPPRAIPQQDFYFCSGDYYVRLVEELRPLTYSLVGRKTKLMPKDEWATILGHSPDVADALIQSMILTP
jgi:phage terminase large subunit